MLLHDKILQAKKRNQPYINLTNEKYSLDEIFNDQNIAIYKKINLKALYLSTSALEINNEFAEQINKLTISGIKEIFIFCAQADSKLTKEIFNNFLQEHKVRINFKIAQLSESDIKQIRADAIGQKDILGFTKIESYNIIYNNDWKVELLNSAKSDQIIRGNYQAYKHKISKAFEFGVKEPEYIKASSELDVRMSKISHFKNNIDLESQLHLEITQNIDINLSVKQEIDQENEVNIDQDQLANKFTELEAYQYAERRYKAQFNEEYLLSIPDSYHNAWRYMHKFFSDPQIKYITQEALDLIIPKNFLFASGININNMPIGLSFKDGIIFASEHRPGSMPIDDFTIQLNYINPTISDPIQYSWLYFATKGTISLNDLYGTKDSPKIIGDDEHPLVKDSSGDIMLDIPYNHVCKTYSVDELRQTPICKSYYEDVPGLSYIKSNMETLDNVFPNILFFNLSNADKQRLQDIWQQLEERKLGNLFSKILLKTGINDGGFLLEERAAVFLNKLFHEILPKVSNDDKNLFFKEILSLFNHQLPYEIYTRRFALEDIFEALHAAYNKFQEFLLTEDIKDEEQKIDLNNKFQAIIKNQLSDTTSYKTTANRIISILEHNTKSGGSLSEQIEYLNLPDSQSLANDPNILSDAKQFSQNILHHATDIQTANLRFGQTFLQPELLVKSNVNITPHLAMYSALKYLSTIAPHQRASIDTYIKHFEGPLKNNPLSLQGECNIRNLYKYYSNSKIPQNLQTSEYITSELLKYKIYIYPMPIINASDDLISQIYKPTIALLNLLIKLSYSLISATSDSIYSILVPENKYDRSFGERSLEAVEKFIEELEELIDPDIPLFNYDSATFIGVNGQDFELFDKYKHKLDKTKLTLPLILESKIKEWNEGEQKTNFINLSHEEIIGTFFETQSPLAMLENYKELEKNASGDALKLHQLLNQAEKNTVIDQCYASLGIVTKEANLVHDFTTKQALENLRLLVLNILSSSGHHYDQQYPDQEFASYTSLFSLLFEKVKIKPIEIGTRKLKVEEDYNKKTITLKEETYLSPSENLEVEQKEELHQKMIAKFLRIYQDNPEFKFGEIVTLGLIANFNDQITNQTVKQAKELLQYNGYLYQLFRVLLSTPSKLGLTGFEELEARANNIARNMLFLTSKLESIDNSATIHEFLTNYGKSPENLVFFAICLGQQTKIDLDQLEGLLNKTTQLEQKIKTQFLSSLASAKLPFINGSNAENSYFLPLTLDILDKPDALNATIEQLKSLHVSYDVETRFNKITKAKLQNSKPNFSMIEDKYSIIFNDVLKSLNFAELKQAILKEPHYIQYNINGRFALGTRHKEMDFDFIVEMFASITLYEQGWQSLHIKSMKLLFNPNQTIAEQLNNIDYNKGYLDDLLKQCINVSDKDQLINLLLKAPLIPYDQQKDILIYLSSIPARELQDLGLTISSFLNFIPKALYIENLSLFKVATDFILTNTHTFNLQEFYQLIERISNIKDSTIFFSKILKYCKEHNEFSILRFVANLNSKSKNFEEIIEWLTYLQAEDIKNLVENVNINLKQLFSIRDIDKIITITDIALKLDMAVSQDQYNKIIKHVARHELDEAKLLKSYLLAPNGQNFTEQEQIELVMNNLESLKEAQILFSQNNLARFSYNLKHVISKIAKIAHKIDASDFDNIPLLASEQQKVYECFITVMEHGKSYKDFNYNELHNKSLELKHLRMLHKDNNINFIFELDLEFIALNIEVMYRETGKFPRDTQILTVLNTIIRDSNLINEVATGQGKSIISAIHAAYLWFTGHTVDIATSSQTLAERDLQQFSSFYNALGIKHSDTIITPLSSIEDYKKGGINYATPSDLALFRADREFYSSKYDISLNTDVSIVCDEIDATLTSDVNFKLAMPLINTNQEEIRVLFNYILDFTEIPAFKNLNISRADDISNLKLFLDYQFEKFDSSLHFPLNAVQIDKLKKTTDITAKTLYNLNQALVKCSKDTEKLFDKLLDSVSLAKRLEKGVHFVVQNIGNDNEQLFKATPIVKDQPSKDTVFGDGVQAFLHLLLERENPEWSMKFDVSPPTTTIFNVSPKNFFDYYRLTGGKIIGLTGTAGSKVELEEFSTINKVITFSIPKFEDDQRIILPHFEVENLDAQYNKTIEVLKDINSNRPVLLFCESTKHAEEVYKLVASQYENVQLCASSALDTGSITQIVEHAGNNDVITITTPMLGRGTDFFTNHHEGYFAINLCTDITFSSLWQIYGRIARNGDRGTAISIFNRDIFAESANTPLDHMELVANDEKNVRMHSQPLTDILKYFGKINHDNTLNAILTNEFITKSWYKLLDVNNKLTQGKKPIIELRSDLVTIVKNQYPETSKNLESYLQLIDNDISKTLTITFNIDYVIQDNHERLNLIFKDSDFNYQHHHQYWNLISIIATSKAISHVDKPIAGSQYHTFYQQYIQVNNAKMLTHTFTLENNVFKFLDILTARFIDDKPSSINNLRFDEINFSISYEGNLIAYLKNISYSPINILTKDQYKYGISVKLAEKIKTYKNSTTTIIPTSKNEIQEIRDYLWEKEKINFNHIIKGEGSSDSLMLDEFKQSFKIYQNFVNSTKVNKISKLIDNFKQIQELDFTNIETGKYQAINIITKVDSSASHAESILTDGKFLFWINRGSETNNGIKIFKIIKDLENVKSVLNGLKVVKSQTDTRKDIYSLLREEDDDHVPAFVLVEMKPQKIGNCGWAQTKGMLKALGIIGHINGLEDLPIVDSQEWQKILKDSNDIYKDFTTFDRIIRAEALLYSLDEEFKPQFLDIAKQKEIEEIRKLVTEPVTYQLLFQLTEKLEATNGRYINTIYEDQYYLILSKLQLETALRSNIGVSLQTETTNYIMTKNLLKNYQNAYLGDFDDLDKIHHTIKYSQLEDKAKESKLFKEIIEFIIKESIELNDITELTDQLIFANKNCAEDEQFNEYCILNQFIKNYIQEEEIIIYEDQCLNIYQHYALFHDECLYKV